VVGEEGDKVWPLREGGGKEKRGGEFSVRVTNRSPYEKIHPNGKKGGERDGGQCVPWCEITEPLEKGDAEIFFLVGVVPVLNVGRAAFSPGAGEKKGGREGVHGLEMSK